MAQRYTTTEDVLNRIDELRTELNTELNRLEATVEDLPNERKLTNVDQVLTVGERYTAVVEDDGSGTDHGDPMVRINGVVTFIQQPDVDVAAGDEVEVVVSATADSHAKGVVPQGGTDD